MRHPRSAVTLAVVVLSVLLAVPAAAAPPAGPPGLERSPREPGNPVAHCLPDRGDEDSENDEPPVETATVTARAETATPPPHVGGVAACVLDSLPDIVGNPHAAAMVDVVVAGIANGFPDGTFRPNQDVTRGQMATFVARALDLHGDGDSDLSDVDGTTHAANIDAVADAGIAHGFVDGTFRPNAPVTRGQMAAFLTRALDLPAASASGLPDVAGTTHQAAIDALVDAGITLGFPDGTFRPADAVSRGQMASFLDRALDL